MARYEATDTDIIPHFVRRGDYRLQGSSVLILTLSFTFVTLLVTAIVEWAWLKKQREPTRVEDENDVHG